MPPKAKSVSADTLSEKKHCEEFILTALKTADAWTTFTDGSCLTNPGPGGAAALLVLSDPKVTLLDELKTIEKSFTSPVCTTNNKMELKGIELALDLLEEHHRVCARKTWFILTDSAYVHGLFEKSFVAHKNAEIITPLRDRRRQLESTLNVKITIVWVKAHCGIYFNDRADIQSKNAAKTSANLPGTRNTAKRNIDKFSSRPNKRMRR